MMRDNLPILLVEDDPIVLDATASLLADGGCDVRRASNAEEALACLEEGPRPAVLVTDIALESGASGLDLARTVAERWPDVRLLIVSGSERPAREDYPERALFFTKPYAGGALLAMVKTEDW
ncbi:MAG TPA: response regulator [Allosphingosinicella sp.]|jgi:CheY-like chemotaxis protein